MEKSDFLQYRALLAEVRQLREQLRVLEASLYSPKGQKFTRTPTASGATKSTMDGAVARHMELERKYRAALEDKEARQLEIEAAIQSLGDTPERVVMRERYIAGHSWGTIIAKMQRLGYSDRTVYRLHGLALTKLKEA